MTNSNLKREDIERMKPELREKMAADIEIAFCEAVESKNYNNASFLLESIIGLWDKYMPNSLRFEMALSQLNHQNKIDYIR